MKTIDLNFLMSAFQGIRSFRWNKEVFKAFVFGVTVGSYVLYMIFRYIEDQTDTAIEENLHRR